MLLTRTSNGRRWIDQTPANTLVVDRLAEMFPGARFLHILRDGRRVVHSMINFHRAMGDPEAVERMRERRPAAPLDERFRRRLPNLGAIRAHRGGLRPPEPRPDAHGHE